MKFHFQLLLALLLLNCTSQVQKHDVVPKHDEFKIDSKILGEIRNINVWTPPEYKARIDSLPVMYMADGGIVAEDFPHISNTLAQLIKEKKIPPMILVGIQNTARRRDLTGPTTVAEDRKIAPVVGGSQQFRAFIREELFPEIYKQYRTKNEKSVIGESLSGLFVVESFFLEPDLFDNYIAFDPSLWWNDQFLLKTSEQYLSNFPKTEKRIWFAGTEDLSAGGG